MLLTTLTLAALCLSCDEPAQSSGPRLGVPEPLVDLGADGCARFQVRGNMGSAPQIEGLYNTGACPGGALKLLSDTTPIFSSATGALRIALRVKNEGTTTVIPRLRLRFFEDSIRLYSATGQPLGWSTDIFAYQPDSSAADQHLAFWFFDTYMAPSGQPQVLPPGATSQRRWIELRGTNWSPQVRLKLAMEGQEAGAVSAVAPDTVPTALLNSLPLLTPSPGTQIRSQMLLVMFQPGTNVATRQAAITSVAGIVVGGQRWFQGDGYYYVRVSTATTFASLAAAADVLEAQSGVLQALLYTVVSPDETSWLRPNDGPNWLRTDWATDPAAAQLANSALERIRAPLAWGCTVGSAATQVAVVDAGLYSPPDLAPNVSALLEPSPLFDHGTQLASIIGARGDNNLGITGVMWLSALHLRNKYTDLLDSTQLSSPPMRAITQNLVAAGLTGASVIVLAQNYRWQGTPPDTTIDPYRRFIRERDRALRSAITVPRQSIPARRPLLVITAGNDGIDARFGGYVGARYTFPEQVLVVGGLSHNISTLNQPINLTTGAGASNHGPAVDVYAPGENVGTLNQSAELPSRVVEPPLRRHSRPASQVS